MKIIDLLVKINNDKNYRPDIKFHNNNYKYLKEYGDYQNDKGHWGILSGYSINMILNDEVEILEEPNKIEKIVYYNDSINWVIDGAGALSDVDKIIIDKLNEVIRKVNKIEVKYGL